MFCRLYAFTSDSDGVHVVAPRWKLVNAYNRQNTFVYTFDYGAQPPTRQAVSQFPLLPSIGLAVEF